MAAATSEEALALTMKSCTVQIFDTHQESRHDHPSKAFRELKLHADILTASPPSPQGFSCRCQTCGPDSRNGQGPPPASVRRLAPVELLAVGLDKHVKIVSFRLSLQSGGVASPPPNSRDTSSPGIGMLGQNQSPNKWSRANGTVLDRCTQEAGRGPDQPVVDRSDMVTPASPHRVCGHAPPKLNHWSRQPHPARNWRCTGHGALTSQRTRARCVPVLRDANCFARLGVSTCEHSSYNARSRPPAAGCSRASLPVCYRPLAIRRNAIAMPLRVSTSMPARSVPRRSKSERIPQRVLRQTAQVLRNRPLFALERVPGVTPLRFPVQRRAMGLNLHPIRRRSTTRFRRIRMSACLLRKADAKRP